MTTSFGNETTNAQRTSNSFLERDRFQYGIVPNPSVQQEVLGGKPPRVQYAAASNQIAINRHFPSRASPTKPLKIIIIRHAERVDAVLGSDWSRKSFDRSGRYVRFNEHLPENLPNRSYLHHYVIDVPLTNRGRIHAFKTGKALQLNNYTADVCYSSPSLRCVQTADGLLNGMGKRMVPIQLEPGLFECYLNDFKRTLCFMTKDELATNGYNIDKNYQVFMPFMRPHDSQLDYYERCRTIMDLIVERHQHTGGTVLVVAHAPSLEGLTRHLTGGKLHPERLFDIARRVPFLAMTIVERNSLDGQWLFRTQPLQTGQTASTRELSVDLKAPKIVATNKINPHGPTIEQVRVRPTSQIVTHDPKKVVKSSTEPNLRQSQSMKNIFRVI